MTTLLEQLDWFVAYREALATHVERGEPPPTYDVSLFEEVERRVDALIRHGQTHALGGRPATARIPEHPPASSMPPPPRTLPVQQLRTTRYAALKDTLMMALLGELDWFVEYRQALAAHRERGAPAPKYDEARFEAVEQRVDALIRDVVDPTYTR